MSEITLRYTVIGVGKCQGCGLIEIKAILQGGTAGDPQERPTSIKVPDPDRIIQPRTFEERIAREIEAMMRGVIPGMGRAKVQMTPMGALVTVGSRGSGTGHGHERNRWRITLTEEEYQAIGPITIGDTLVQAISKEKASG